MFVALGFLTLLNVSGFEILFLFLGVVKAFVAALDCFKLAFGVAVSFEGGLVLSFPPTIFREIEEMTANLDILGFEDLAGAVSGHFELELAKPKRKWHQQKPSELKEKDN